MHEVVFPRLRRAAFSTWILLGGLFTAALIGFGAILAIALMWVLSGFFTGGVVLLTEYIYKSHKSLESKPGHAPYFVLVPLGIITVLCAIIFCVSLFYPPIKDLIGYCAVYTLIALSIYFQLNDDRYPVKTMKKISL